MEARVQIKDSDGNHNSSTYPLYTSLTNTTVAFAGYPGTATVTIALGEATSGVIDLAGACLVGLITPTALTNSTVTLLAAATSGGTFVPVYTDAGTAVQLVVATNASRAIGLDSYAVAASPWRYVKFKTGTAATSATEAATRTFTLVTK